MSAWPDLKGCAKLLAHNSWVSKLRPQSPFLLTCGPFFPAHTFFRPLVSPFWVKQVGCDPANHKKWGGACAALKLYLM